MNQETGTGENPRRRMKDRVLFCAATFMFWAALYLYVPVLPAHAERLDAGLVMVGAIVASYAIAQFLLRIPVGVSADLLGRRKPFVAAGLLFAALGAAVMALADTPWTLFAGRTITGVAAASWVISTVFFASYFPRDQTARGIAIISVVNSIALVAATSIGGQLADRWDADLVFVIAAAVGVLGVLFLLPIAEPKMRRHQAPSSRAYLEVATQPLLLMVSLISAFVHFANFATIFSFTLVYAARIGADAGELGLVTGAFLGAATLGTLGTMILVERRGYAFTILLGATALGIGLLLVPLSGTLTALLGLQLLAGAGRGLSATGLMALSISAVEPANRATAMGVYQAIYSIGMLTGPLLGGMIADWLGLGGVFYVSGALVLFGGALVHPTVRLFHRPALSPPAT